MKVVKSENTEKKVDKDFQTKWKEHKEKYLKDHTVEEMVYENGSALALVIMINQLTSLWKIMEAFHLTENTCQM